MNTNDFLAETVEAKRVVCQLINHPLLKDKVISVTDPVLGDRFWLIHQDDLIWLQARLPEVKFVERDLQKKLKSQVEQYFSDYRKQLERETIDWIKLNSRNRWLR